ncbi:MAG: pentapeptide repeat-containing protein [Giesbergeria sp.]
MGRPQGGGSEHVRWLLERDDIVGSSLHAASIPGAYLRGAKLAYADLRGAKLEGADLRRARLRGAVRLPTDPPIPYGENYLGTSPLGRLKRNT